MTQGKLLNLCEHSVFSSVKLATVFFRIVVELAITFIKCLEQEQALKWPLTGRLTIFIKFNVKIFRSRTLSVKVTVSNKVSKGE